MTYDSDTAMQSARAAIKTFLESLQEMGWGKPETFEELAQNYARLFLFMAENLFPEKRMNSFATLPYLQKVGRWCDAQWLSSWHTFWTQKGKCRPRCGNGDLIFCYPEKTNPNLTAGHWTNIARY